MKRIDFNEPDSLEKLNKRLDKVIYILVIAGAIMAIPAVIVLILH